MQLKIIVSSLVALIVFFISLPLGLLVQYFTAAVLDGFCEALQNIGFLDKSNAALVSVIAYFTGNIGANILSLILFHKLAPISKGKKYAVIAFAIVLYIWSSFCVLLVCSAMAKKGAPVREEWFMPYLIISLLTICYTTFRLLTQPLKKIPPAIRAVIFVTVILVLALLGPPGWIIGLLALFIHYITRYRKRSGKND